MQLADILALNCRGEIIYDNWFPEATDGCTSFALIDDAAGDGHVYAGQNWDWRHAIRDTVVVLRVVQPPKPTLIMQVEAGQIGRHGANSAGLALNANGLGGRFDDAVGMPQTIIRRAVLDAPNLADALKILTWTKAHIPSNALVTHRDGFSIDIETTPGGHGWEYAVNGLLVHGNHYQVLSRQPPPLVSPDSLIRVPQARKGLAKAAVCEKSRRRAYGDPRRDVGSPRTSRFPVRSSGRAAAGRRAVVDHAVELRRPHHRRVLRRPGITVREPVRADPVQPLPMTVSLRTELGHVQAVDHADQQLLVGERVLLDQTAGLGRVPLEERGQDLPVLVEGLLGATIRLPVGGLEDREGIAHLDRDAGEELVHAGAAVQPDHGLMEGEITPYDVVGATGAGRGLEVAERVPELLATAGR